ncbi:hypothetical protein ElyMa_006778100 [Elysia marginata]|uniref:Uncharacterized protein n=1 Tax=Elysia marginata TaxID=1093978 RepID=A0AAV4IZ77_9GAST|nr:hypothetical protein ElyMa_006778100 [Elysia marginata]
MEIRCYRRLLGISYKEYISNEEVRGRIENAIGPHVDLLIIIRQRKLMSFTRSSGLAKSIMQGKPTVNKGRNAEETLGRQHQRIDRT